MSKWVSAIDGIEKQAIEEWSIGLAGLTGDDIGLGLERTRDLEWPPSIKEFRKLCLPEKDAHRQNAAAYRMYKQLPKPRPDHKKVDDSIKAMRKLLGIHFDSC